MISARLSINIGRMDSGQITSLLAQAVARHQAGNLDGARILYEQVLALDDRNVMALTGLGTIHGHLGQRHECVRLLGKSLEIQPNQPVALNNRGVALRDLKHYDKALASYDRALALMPDYASAYINRALVLKDLGRLAEALANCNRALAINPENAAAYNHRGLVLQDLKRLDDALASFDRAVAMDPRHAEAHNNRSVVLSNLRRFDEALTSVDRAIALKPDFAAAYYNRGIVLQNLNRLDDALASYDRALAIDPGYGMAQWNKAVVLLRMGNYAEGWSLYDWRWKAGVVIKPAYITQREWAGEKLQGTLLVWGDQGLGDQIMFSVLTPELAHLTGRFTLAVEPRLVPLLKRSFPELEIMALEGIPSGGPFDAQIALTHLGRFLRTKFSDFPPEGPPLLKADAARSLALRRTIGAGNNRICGLSWRSTNEVTGQDRTLRLQSLLPLFSMPGTTWIDLQYGNTRDERTSLEAATGVKVVKLEEIDNRQDIDGLAALITACDLIVTTDNTTAHLAAALGKPTWIMLPFASDYRWLMDREDSPWYPTVRLFRQARRDDWPGVIHRISDAMAR